MADRGADDLTSALSEQPHPDDSAGTPSTRLLKRRKRKCRRRGRSTARLTTTAEPRPPSSNCRARSDPPVSSSSARSSKRRKRRRRGRSRGGEEACVTAGAAETAGSTGSSTGPMPPNTPQRRDSSVKGGVDTGLICAACGTSGKGLKKCTACKSVRYCDVDCQRSHRKAHRKECKRIEKELKAAAAAARTNPCITSAPEASLGGPRENVKLFAEFNEVRVSSHETGGLDGSDEYYYEGSSSAEFSDEDEAKLWHAVARGNIKTVKSIFDRILADPNDHRCLSGLAETSNTKTEETLLMVACRRNDLEMVRYLLQKGQSTEGGPPGFKVPKTPRGSFVNTVDKRLSTALHRAVSVRNDEMINALLDEGAMSDYFFGDNPYLLHGQPSLKCHLPFLKQSTNKRLRESYEEVYGEMEGGWPMGVAG